ncbi:tetratricopeptide repeat protein [Pseudomonas stutzeri]|nr:tetratricopeptide repeat protein [Stutzerimonas stutzeri]
MTSQTEEEQLAAIKDWWQRNGKPLLAGGALALVGMFGWQFWQNHQTNQTHAASVLYQQLVEITLNSPAEPDVAKVGELAGRLGKDFAGSHYAQYASLLLARVAVDSGRLDEAAAELRKVLDKPADATLGEVARQRLARVLAAQEKTEEALALLAGEAAAAFVAGREELRGDLLARLGRSGEARSAYEKARAALPQEAGLGTLQIKLDDLADGDA